MESELYTVERHNCTLMVIHCIRVCVLLCQVLCLLLPLRYSLVGIGGSWAQIQVLTLTIIHAALKAKQLKLAMALVSELKVRSAGE